MKRRTTQPPEPTPALDITTLQEQLRLSRAQCAYLHRELATALKQAPLAATDFDGDDVDAMMAENADLRQRLATLTRFHEDLQRRCTLLEIESARRDRECQELRHLFFGWKRDGVQSTLVAETVDVSRGLLVDERVDISRARTQILSLAHPDRWSKGELAITLAHEATMQLIALRERLGGRA